jgi:alpha-glucosidase
MMKWVIAAGVMAATALGSAGHAQTALRSETRKAAEPGRAVAPVAAEAVSISPRPDGMDLHVGRRLMRITALDGDIVRVRIGLAGTLPADESWAVLQSARRTSAKVRAVANGFAAGSLVVTADPATGRLSVTDTSGRLLYREAETPSARDGSGFQLVQQMPEDAHYFGLGDKTGPLDRRGQAFTLWNTDSYGFQESTDPIYKSIPFFVQVSNDGHASGLLMDNNWRSFFDFGRTDRGLLRFGAESGPIDYYILAGPTTKDVVERYARLTGPSPLPPSWSLGFQQSRWSYMSAAEVRDIAAHHRKDGIPLDTIYLDIDYQDRSRPFTVNAKTFPDLPGLARDLKGEGIRLVAITDLHIADAPNQGYTPFDSGMAGDQFVKNAAGRLYVANVWPGASVFPDFTRAKTRDWWGSLYKGFVGDGIAGFWNDMNEPAVFDVATKTMPLDNRHRIEEPGFATRTATHAEIHNVYGMENSRATYEGLLKLSPNERPFVLTRASYAGGQRYAATWTGDNSSSWNHLRLSVSQLVNLGMSGFAWSGADVGGFAGVPTADLLTRWIEIAAFQPIFRDHSAAGTPHQEVWVHGPQQEAIRKRYIEARYRLMPYFYAVADETARTGLPMMRPVFMTYPEALTASCDTSGDFLVGDRLLVAPPNTPESPESYNICLPKGGWYDYWTGGLAPAKPYEAPKLDRLPVYVRAGTILPRQPLVQSTMETPNGPLELAVYAGPNCAGTLYADDGHSLDYQRGVFLRQQLSCTMTPKGLTLAFAKREGSWKPWWKTMTVSVYGWKGLPHASLGGRDLPASVDAGGVLHVTLPDQPGAASVVIGG